MAGYTRQSVADIINGANITAPPLNAEFNQILAAFNSSTGHSHDGSTGNAPKIPLTTSVSGYLPVVHGGVGGRNNTTATSDPTATNDNTEGYAPGSIWINASTGYSHLCLYNTTNAANWVTIAAISNTNIIAPKATNTVDLGTSTLQFKDLYVDGIGYIDDINAETMSSTGNVDVGGNLTVSGAVTFTTSASIGGATTLESLGVTNNFTVGGTAGITGNVTMSGDVTIHGSTILGNAATDTVEFKADVSSDLIPSADDTHSLGAVDNEWKDLFIDGTANIDSLVADTADIDGGSLDGVDIGAGTASTASFTGLTVSSTASFTGVTTDDLGTVTTADIDGGSIDGVTIGTNTAVTDLRVDNLKVDGNAITSTNENGDIDITPHGTGEVNISKVDIDAGAIDNTTIGGTTAAAGSFTTVSTTGQATLATAVISGGSVDDTPIGATTASTGAFTTLASSSGITGALTGNVTGNVTGDIYSEDGQVKILENGSDGTNATFTGAVTGDVTGNISASSGTSTFENVTVNGTIDFTQAVLSDVADPTNAQDAATKNYVDTELSALVDSSPDTLNTLNELAAALGDDADFSTTVTNSIAEKLPLAGGTMTGAIAMGDNKVTGVTDPTDAQDASTKAYTDAQRDTRLALAGGTMTGNITLGTNKITTTADPTNADDLARKGYVDAIHGSAVAAATSATNASNSKTAAANSATAALASQNAALASQNAAAASYDSFDDRYLGAKSSAPTVDNDGDALVIGALYFDTTAQIMKVYGSSGWQSAGSAVNGTSERYKFTATANQNTFSGNDDNGNALGYDAGFLDVFLSGIRLVNGTDFTATSGTSIQLASGAAVGDILEIVTYGTFVLSNQTLSDMTDVNTGGVSTNDILAYNGTNFVPTSTPNFTSMNIGTITSTGNISLNQDGATLFIGADIDMRITHDGSNGLLRNDTGLFTLDVAGDIRLDAGGGNIQLIKGGTEFGRFFEAGTNDFYIYNPNSDKDIVLYGNDSGTSFEAVRFDMSTEGAATFNSSVTSTSLTTNELDLTAIAQSKSDTAVDIFVYDTSKDSDGGAWRHRTQHTSWYNETLNTSTRGATKKFPSVAVIVTDSSADTVTIYDGDNPDIPMWMVFTVGSQGMANRVMLQYTGQDKVVHMLNGVLVVGHRTNSDNYGSPIINFISEKVVRADAQTGEGGTWQGNIANRNNAYGYVAGGGYLIPNSIINDVAMTVLPNAPIDADTGLPVPTIVLMTAGSQSVIKDNGTVVNGVHLLNLSSCDITDDYRIVAARQPSSGSGFYSGPSLIGIESNFNIIDTYQYDDTTVPAFRTGSTNAKVTKEAHGSDIGLVLLDEKISAPTKGSVAYIESDYNTGWMHGDIKLATLSDTDDTNVTSANMASNGNFADTSVWAPANGASLSVSGNVGTITADGSTTQAYIGQTVTGLTVGKQYIITCDAKRGTTSAAAAITVNGILSAMTSSTSFVPLHVTFTATATSQLVLCFLNGSGSQSGTALFQNFTFRLAEADRSVNGASPHGGNALQVHGTITKTAVATGADLVAYSGFSSSNYLSQPPNTDLDFGTGDFCAMGWFKSNTGTGGNQAFFFRGQTDTNGYAMIEPYIRADGRVDVLTRNAAEGTTYFTTATSVLTQQWVQWCMVRSSGVMYFYLNGVVDGSQANTRDLTPSTSAKKTFRIGNSWNGQKPIPGSVALFRISATAPTAEQIAKIYNDEKHLFSENAKATLYGSSDAVTALAYDDDTELLHAGTSAGRSVFQGLRRVENTTDAVGSAISASNGLVAED